MRRDPCLKRLTREKEQRGSIQLQNPARTKKSPLIPQFILMPATHCGLSCLHIKKVQGGSYAQSGDPGSWSSELLLWLYSMVVTLGTFLGLAVPCEPPLRLVPTLLLEFHQTLPRAPPEDPAGHTTGLHPGGVFLGSS